MTTCNADSRGVLPCPSTVEQHRRSAVRLLPPGFAWQAADQPGTVMFGYWRAVARTLKWFTDQVCVLTNELFCSTRNVLADDYNREFNLPDPCSPYLSPCSFKIVDRARCTDLADVLLALGWVIECAAVSANSAVGCMVSGCNAVVGGVGDSSRMVIRVITSESPVYVPTQSSASGLAACGCAVSGCEATGAGTISSLRCVIDRFLPAHIGYNLEVVT